MENTWWKKTEQSNVSTGTETENVYCRIFRKSAIGILNISKYVSQTCTRRKEQPITTNKNLYNFSELTENHQLNKDSV